MDELEAALGKTIDYQIGEYTPNTDVNSVTLIQGDGIYEIVDLPLGVFTMRTEKRNFTGLPITVKEGFQMHLPKIPKEIFLDYWNFFRDVNTKMETEILISLFYDTDKKEYFWHIPKQEISKARVGMDKEGMSELRELGKKYIPVLETHSHNTMGGLFSSVDDEDQQEMNIIHLVIGNVEKAFPTFQIRFKDGDKAVNLSFEDIFEPLVDYKYDETQFEGWEDKIVEQKKVFVNTKASGKYMGKTLTKIHNALNTEGIVYQSSIHDFDPVGPIDTKSEIDNLYEWIQA